MEYIDGKYVFVGYNSASCVDGCLAFLQSRHLERAVLVLLQLTAPSPRLPVCIVVSHRGSHQAPLHQHEGS